MAPLIKVVVATNRFERDMAAIFGGGAAAAGAADDVVRRGGRGRGAGGAGSGCVLRADGLLLLQAITPPCTVLDQWPWQWQ